MNKISIQAVCIAVLFFIVVGIVWFGEDKRFGWYEYGFGLLLAILPAYYLSELIQRIKNKR